MSKLRVLIHSQSLVGLGHIVRAATLANALSGDCEVCVLGGWTPGLRVSMGTGVRCVPLIPLRLNLKRNVAHPLDFEEDASCLETSEPQLEPGQALELRRQRILREIQEFEPHLILTEYYPLGRWVFGQELLPGIDYARRRGARIVCAVRDILKPMSHHSPWRERLGAEYEAGFLRYYRRAVDLLNQSYDALFVHADSALVDLGLSVLGLEHLRIPLIYTGYLSSAINLDVSPPGQAAAPRPGVPYFILSAGGGYGERDYLLKWLSPMTEVLSDRFGADSRLLLLAGPLMEESGFSELKKDCEAHPQVQLLRYSNSFQNLLDGALVSVSRAGYNTAVDVLRSTVPAVLTPADHLSDQRLRAERFEAAGAAVLCDSLGSIVQCRAALETALVRGHWHRRFNVRGERLTRDAVFSLLQRFQPPAAQ